MRIVHDTQARGAQSYSADREEHSEIAFTRAYPSFMATRTLDALRTTDYARLDAENHIYLDYTGGGLYAASQVSQHRELLAHHVFGNPHSHNPTSLAMTSLVDQARASVLRYFNASSAEYEVVFTHNASAALKLVGEAYPFTPGARYVLSADNHNSVNGIREFARQKGAAVLYVPVVAPKMRLDDDMLMEALDVVRPHTRNLFAFPAQSNFSGVQHPLKWVAYAQARGWAVLLDAAAFVPTNRLDLSTVTPEFVSLSFYKMFGYPTGVGALLARKSALATLRRPWFAGGTITIASVKGDGFYYVDGGAAFEDGTVDYLSLPAVEIGLQHIERIGMETIHERVTCLSGWLLENLRALRHTNGQNMVQLHGPETTDQRGATIAFNFLDPQGLMLHYQRIEELAAEHRISLRTGCFCNPGAGEIAYGMTDMQMRAIFAAGKPYSFLELYELMHQQGKDLGAIRISVGLATTFRDVFRFMDFAASLRDQTIDTIGAPTSMAANAPATPDTA